MATFKFRMMNCTIGLLRGEQGVLLSFEKKQLEEGSAQYGDAGDRGPAREHWAPFRWGALDHLSCLESGFCIMQTFQHIKRKVYCKCQVGTLFLLFYADTLQ